MRIIFNGHTLAALILFVFSFFSLSAKSSKQNIEVKDSAIILENARYSYLSGNYEVSFQKYQSIVTSSKSLIQSDWIKFRGAAILLGDKELFRFDELFKAYGYPVWSNEIFVNTDIVDGDFKAHRLEWNSDNYEEFAPFLFKGKLFLTSSQPNYNANFGKYFLNKQSYYDIYYIDSFGQLKNANDIFNRLSAKSLNSHLHDGPFTANADGSRIIITRNTPTQKGQIGMGLFETVLSAEKNTYSALKLLDKTSKQFNNQHAFFHTNNQKIYFSSDKFGGFGGFDLYSMDFDSNSNSWLEPINLGTHINTAGDEVFPTFFNDILYFSSNGYKTTGNLDIMMNNEKGTRELSQFNSVWDDYHPFFVNDSIGYFCSNRFNGYGSDDILAFSFKEITKIKEYKFILNHVEIDTLITEVLVSFGGKDTSLTVLGRFFTFKPSSSFNDSKLVVAFKTEGYFQEDTILFLGEDSEIPFKLSAFQLPTKPIPVLILEANEQSGEIPKTPGNLFYKVSVDGQRFFDDSAQMESGVFSKAMPIFKDVNTVWFQYDLHYKGYLNLSDSFRMNISGLDSIYLNLFSPRLKAIQKTQKGLDIGKYYNIGMIYFDLNKYDIREDAAIELNKIIKALNDNPEISIELGSHTDCRGTTISNQKLSQKRAEASVSYIVDKGFINPNRITSKGYGESKIINKCIDGVLCTPDEHSVNRRTEFKITNVVLD